MKKCISGRQTGKTEKLIKLSAEKQIPILVTSKRTAEELKMRALFADINMPAPISIHDLMSDYYINKIVSIDNIIVDDADHILSYILSTRKVRSVEAIAMSTDDLSDELI